MLGCHQLYSFRVPWTLKGWNTMAQSYKTLIKASKSFIILSLYLVSRDIARKMFGETVLLSFFLFWATKCQQNFINMIRYSCHHQLASSLHRVGERILQQLWILFWSQRLCPLMTSHNFSFLTFLASRSHLTFKLKEERIYWFPLKERYVKGHQNSSLASPFDTMTVSFVKVMNNNLVV